MESLPLQRCGDLSKSEGFSKHAGVALIVVTILSLAVAGFAVLNPHSMTVTKQQLVTITQSIQNTQTVTVAGTQTITSMTATTSRAAPPPGYYQQYCNAYNCGGYAPPPGTYNTGCYMQGPLNVLGNTSVQCYGWLYKDPSGCVDLLVPVSVPGNNQVQQYYFLQNLPASHPAIGTWVTVTGELYEQGNSVGPTGASCPSSYIVVTSIS